MRYPSRSLVLCGCSIPDAHPGSQPSSYAELVTWFQYAVPHANGAPCPCPCPCPCTHAMKERQLRYGHKAYLSLSMARFHRCGWSVSATIRVARELERTVDPRRRQGGPPSSRSSSTAAREAIIPQIVVYPMVPSMTIMSHRLLPRPALFHPFSIVSSFSVDPTGMTLLVSTIAGTVEIWNMLLPASSNHPAVLSLPVPGTGTGTDRRA
jgi:hypothetical protein